MESKLPWEVKFDGNVDRRMIKDGDRRDVNCYYRENAEFVVEAVNSYEANQAEIAQLKAKLELCRVALHSIVDECVYYQTSVGEPTFYKVSRALEAMGGTKG